MNFHQPFELQLGYEDFAFQVERKPSVIQNPLTTLAIQWRDDLSLLIIR